MDYITAKEASVFWGISQRRVAVLCSEERIDGAKLLGNMWLIPVGTGKPDDARSLRFQPKTPASVKPFLKWAGGKAQILENIKMKYPTKLGKSVSRYAEPFVGGGAVLFDVLSNYDMKEVYISDINRELILTYKIIRKNVDELISHLKHLEANYLPAGEEKRKELYYQNRERFNVLKIACDESPEIAALFIALNKTCFNGLYRVNSKGEFNVPQGDYKNPRICDAENLAAISEKLKNVQIICGDYKESAQFIDNSTFVYFDPPYRPLTESANFTSYTQHGFGDKEQVELARFIDKMSERGAHVVASNSDPKRNVLKCITNKGDRSNDMTQEQQVIEIMRKLGGFATFGKLNHFIDFTSWKTKTPEASVRRIVQNSPEIFRIKPGLWALKECEDDILTLFNIIEDKGENIEKFTHSYYQGLAAEIGNLRNMETYVPNQDRNKLFLDKPLKEVAKLHEIYQFTYPEFIRFAKTVDVIWFNERRMPFAFFEIEHSTDIQNSLMKFYELQDFNAEFFIVADEYRRTKFKDILSRSLFRPIKNRVKFRSYDALSDIHSHAYKTTVAGSL